MKRTALLDPRNALIHLLDAVEGIASAAKALAAGRPVDDEWVKSEVQRAASVTADVARVCATVKRGTNGQPKGASKRARGRPKSSAPEAE